MLGPSSSACTVTLVLPSAGGSNQKWVKAGNSSSCPGTAGLMATPRADNPYWYNSPMARK